MIQIGILLIVLGFGSLILENLDMEFRLMSWASDMQPAAGIIVGLIGIGLIAAAIMMRRKQHTDSKVGEWSGNGQWAGSAPSAPQTQNPGGAPYGGRQHEPQGAWSEGAPGQQYGQTGNPLQAPSMPTYGGPTQAAAPGQQQSHNPGIAYGQQGQYNGGRPADAERPQEGPGFGGAPRQQ